MTPEISPWSLSPVAEAEVEALREADRVAEEASIDRMLMEHYHHKQHYIGRKIIFDRDDPNYDPYLLEI